MVLTSTLRGCGHKQAHLFAAMRPVAGLRAYGHGFDGQDPTKCRPVAIETTRGHPNRPQPGWHPCKHAHATAASARSQDAKIALDAVLHAYGSSIRVLGTPAKRYRACAPTRTCVQRQAHGSKNRGFILVAIPAHSEG